MGCYPSSCSECSCLCVQLHLFTHCLFTMNTTDKSSVSFTSIWFTLRLWLLELSLLCCAVGSLFGGLKFIRDPTGQTLKVPSGVLEEVIEIGLASWFIPGTLLIAQFCVLPIASCALLFVNRKLGVLLSCNVAVLLFSWIVAQLINLGLNVPGMQITCILLALCIGFLAVSLH